MANVEGLLEEAFNNIKTFVISPNHPVNLIEHGFTVKEAWEAMHDHIEGQ